MATNRPRKTTARKRNYKKEAAAASTPAKKAKRAAEGRARYAAEKKHGKAYMKDKEMHKTKSGYVAKKISDHKKTKTFGKKK
jgi:hypothetical protein